MSQGVRVKVCGHTRPEDVTASVAAGVDAVGVIADVPVETPREVSLEQAETLLAGVPPLVTGVLVSMPKTLQQARTLLDTVAPDAIQIHGGLDPEAVAALNTSTDTEVLAAVDAGDPATVEAYADAADALLIDSIAADGGGGTGQTHDWEQTASIVRSVSVPVLLAGGLTPENVADAVITVDPFGVDVASGVERTGGHKDTDAVAAFVTAAKQAEVRERE